MRDRTTLFASFALLAGLAAGSYWLAERARQNDVRGEQRAHEPDYFVERFLQVRMDDRGLPLYTVEAGRMTHFADDDSTTLDAPVVVSRKPDRPVVEMQADTGQLSSDAERVQLAGNVSLRRAASATSAALDARTSYLLVLPEQDIARTNRPVHVTQGGSAIDAQSLEYDNGYRDVKFNTLASGRGRAVIEPRHREAAQAAVSPPGAKLQRTVSPAPASAPSQRAPGP
jgi:lipopolysaccharide export system protein LptC